MNIFCGYRVVIRFGVDAARRSGVQLLVTPSRHSTLTRTACVTMRSLYGGRREIQHTKLTDTMCCQTYHPNRQVTARYLSSVESSRGNASGGITASTESPESIGMKIMKLIGWLGGFYSKSSVLLRSAMKTYECCIEGISYEDFYEACGMPDTFQSWFLVNQLHVWMCLVRLKAEGKDGQYMYRKLVSIMWQDIEARIKIMGEIDSSVARESLRELVQEFYGLIFAYDEGLLSHDRVLAAALWRNMFHEKKKTDAVQLGQLVEYIRRQVQHLDSLDSEELLTTGKITWLPFRKKKDQEPFLFHAY